MIIFAMVMFGFAGVRTLAKIVEARQNKASIYDKIGTLVVAITYWWCYIWFLTQYIILK